MLSGLDSVLNWDYTTWAFGGSLATLSVVGILYLHKRHQQARHKVADDRRNFVYLFVPVLVLSAFSLWLLFFRNPFKTGSVKQTDFFARSILGGGSFYLENAGLLGGTAGGGGGPLGQVLGGGSLGKKFLWGFVCGMTSIIALRNRYTTNNFIKAIVI